MARKPPFKFPPCWEYPPFWTIQTNPEEKDKQLRLWSNVICAYVKYRGDFVVNVTSLKLICKNDKLNRALSESDLMTIANYMVKSDRAMWDSESKASLRIFWRTVREWGNILHGWAKRCGISNVQTVADIRDREEWADEKFHGLDAQIILLAGKLLESENKAKIIVQDQGAKTNLDEHGIKFLI